LLLVGHSGIVGVDGDGVLFGGVGVGVGVGGRLGVL